MKLSNIKSNPYYHFVDVDDTFAEINEMQNWCTNTFGITHSHLWDMDKIVMGQVESTRQSHNGPFQKTNYTFIYRFRFAKIEHRDWFIVRWS